MSVNDFAFLNFLLVILAIIIWPWVLWLRGRIAIKESRREVRKAQTALEAARKEHEEMRQEMLQDKERIASTLATTRKELGDARQQLSELKSQIGYLPGLAARIRHDIPKRLKRLWQFLQVRLKGWPAEELAFLEEELDSVVRKIELHLVSEDNLKNYVAETLKQVTLAQARNPAQAPPLVSLSKYLRWLADSNHFKQVVFEEMAVCQMRSLPMHWDLMLTNILSNADYYSSQERNGRIEVSTRMTGPDRVEINITNGGPHISSRVRDHVFRLGYSTKDGGRGLGLFVAREIARGLGGDILPPENMSNWIFMNRGVRFTLVNLPVVEKED